MDKIKHVFLHKKNSCNHLLKMINSAVFLHLELLVQYNNYNVSF